MSPEKQRIAIAEACGWLWKPDPNAIHPSKLRWWVAPWLLADLGAACGCPDSSPPDFPNDLNAMHEAEDVIGDSIWEDYRDALCGVCAAACAAENKRSNQWWRATAAQRAEAFLKTIGKWEET